ncbi:MAG: DUF624 domain-containing protein [Blautia producta]
MSFMEYDSPIMAGIGKVIDIIWLSTLWFICCLPIVTIGASTTALYYTSVKAIRKNRGYVTKTFFHAFKMNFFPRTGDMASLSVGNAAVLCEFCLCGSDQR